MVDFSFMGIGIFVVAMIAIVFFVKFLGKKTIEGHEIAQEKYEKQIAWQEKREETMEKAEEREEIIQENMERMDLKFEQILYVYHTRLLNFVNRARLMAKQYPNQKKELFAPYIQTTDWLIGQASTLLTREQQEEKVEKEEIKKEKPKREGIKKVKNAFGKLKDLVKKEKKEIAAS